MKERIKALVRERLQNRRIILFGVDQTAKEFYQEVKGKLPISHCVSNAAKEWGEKAFLGELDVRPFRKDELEENDYLIVCGSVVFFRNIELQLSKEGLSMYDDFVESHIAEVVFSNKKFALFYGQCILRDIYQRLIQVPAFSKEYKSVFTQTIKHQAVVINRLLYYAKDICDLYIYTPRILDRDSIYALSPEEMPADCKIVSVSNLTASIYWPQINTKLDEYNRWYLHSYNSERSRDFYHTLYRKEDCNINRMVLEGKSTKEIVDTLSAEDYYSEKQVKRGFQYAMKLIQIAEKDVDIKVADFILENFRKQMLYQNFIHPNKCIIYEYIRRLLHTIDISTAEIDELEREAPMHEHQSGDVPIYPSVIKALELEFADDTTKYEVMIGSGMVYMTFREYMEHFAEYTRKTMEISRLFGEQA